MHDLHLSYRARLSGSYASVLAARAVAEAWALFKGSPLDTENTRSYIRSAVFDPLTPSPTRLVNWMKRDNSLPLGKANIGKSLEVPFKGFHFNFYHSYKRWSIILKSLNGEK